MDIIGRNLPSHKPQLWEMLWLSPARKLTYSIAPLVQPDWRERPVVVKLARGDLRMEVIPSDVIGGNIFIFGVWEIVGTRLLESLLQPGMVFVDVGANIGYYSLVASRLVGSSGHVIAFEPVAAIRQRFERNIRLNQFTNVSVRSDVVARVSGEVAFYAVDQVANMGLSSMLPGPGTSTVAVSHPSVTLDDALTNGLDGRQTVLKIDVEGAEAEVFAGSRNLLSGDRRPGAIMFEATAVGDHIELLEHAGYDVRAVDYSMRSGLQFIEPSNISATLAMRERFIGQGTLDFLALDQAGAKLTFAELTHRSFARIPVVLRLLAKYL
jgi:FkbM family methyltransferase